MNSLPSSPFGLSDLPSLGLTRDQLRALVKAGAVRRIFYGVYLRTDVPDTIETRAACAAYALPEHCVVSDRSAAWLHGVDTYDIAQNAGYPPLEIVSRTGHPPTSRPGVRGGKRALADEDVMTLHGVKVTTPLRTACDVASLHGRLAAMAVLDQFCRLHGVTGADIARTLPRLVGRRGVKQLRELAPYVTPLAESPSESWTRLSAIDAGFPPPQPQIWVYVEGVGWVRLDMGWEEPKVALEYDGEEFHSSPADREHDQRRREALAAAGWIVIVIRKDGFSGAGLDRWMGELRRAFAERQPRRPAKRKYSRGESRPPYHRTS
ncbi:hypothetical protein [Nocardioides salsibiostraticola]